MSIRGFGLYALLLDRLPERNARFPAVLVVIPEIDHVSAAEVRPSLAAQVFRVYRQQVLLGVSQPRVLIIGGRFHVVGRKRIRESVSLHLDPQHARRRRVTMAVQDDKNALPSFPCLNSRGMLAMASMFASATLNSHG